MGRDADRNRSEEQAAWRDLVARLELPLPVDPARPPWPDRENLGPATHAARDELPGKSPADRGELDISQLETRPDLPAVGRPPGRPPAAPESPEDAPGSGHSGHVVKNPGNAGTRTGEHRRSPSSHGRTPTRHGRAISEHGRVIRPAVPADPAPSPAGSRHVDDLADDSALGSGSDPRDRYVPPPVPALPRSSSVTRAAWAALFGGPAFLFLGTLLKWNAPAWAELTAIAAFVVGFVLLVVRLGDGPSKGDGPDQGAVV